jgi:hypothetical protein
VRQSPTPQNIQLAQRALMEAGETEAAQALARGGSRD